VASLVCAGAGAKSKWRAATPLGRTGQAPQRAKGKEAIAPPEFGPRLMLADLHDPKLRAEAEKVRAWAAADRLRQWFLAFLAGEGVPLDTAYWPVEYVALWAEASMLAAVQWSGEYEPAVFPLPADPIPGRWAAVSYDAAVSAGLTPRPDRSRGEVPPTLPGCAGKDYLGRSCHRLRVIGHDFCPSCEQVNAMDAV
jgi:hypothetical protein